MITLFNFVFNIINTCMLKGILSVLIDLCLWAGSADWKVWGGLQVDL
jgi:hypothetical protein